MKIAPAAVTPPAPLLAQSQPRSELNPAKQAKAADPAVKGAAFGAHVSELAHARNAARFAAKHDVPAPAGTVPTPIVQPPVAEEEIVPSSPSISPVTDTDATLALALLQGEEPGVGA